MNRLISRCRYSLMKKSILKTVFVLSITIVIFYAIFTKIDFYSVVDILSSSNPFWLSIALFLSLFTVAIIAKRWQTLLKTMGYNLQYEECFNLIMGALPLTSITPSKSGISEREEQSKSP